eukprot:scaffold5017_cov200-Pinguiococcus_pyrenoidosus.AAC.2
MLSTQFAIAFGVACYRGCAHFLPFQDCAQAERQHCESAGWLCTRKHPVHVCNAARVPDAKIPVEGAGVQAHALHIGNAAGVSQALVSSLIRGFVRK